MIYLIDNKIPLTLIKIWREKHIILQYTYLLSAENTL